MGLLTTFVRKLPACFPIKVREAEQFPRLFSDAAKKLKEGPVPIIGNEEKNYAKHLAPAAAIK